MFGIASIKDVGDLNETLKRVFDKGEENFKQIADEIQTIKSKIGVLESSEQKEYPELQIMEVEIGDLHHQVGALKEITEKVLEIVEKVLSKEFPKPVPVPKTPVEEIEEVRETVKKIGKKKEHEDEKETKMVGYCLNCEDDRKMKKIEIKDTRKGKMFRGKCVECGRVIYVKYDKALAASVEDLE